jgi:hypothetical protein
MQHNLICHQIKEHGERGLRIPDLDVHYLYVSLVNGCIYLLNNKYGVWQQLLMNKYFGNKNLSQVGKKQESSHF